MSSQKQKSLEKSLDSLRETIRTRSISSLISAKRLDVFLVSIFPQYTRSYFQHLIKQGSITINNHLPDNHTSVKSHDIIAIEFPRVRDTGIIPEHYPLTILLENQELLAINKPSGILCHPTDYQGKQASTIVNFALHHTIENRSAHNVYLAHRLDKDTSGVLLLTKTLEVQHQIQQEFKHRRVYKEYLALVSGSFPDSFGSIDASIGHSKQNHTKMTINYGPDAKHALSEFQVLCQYSLTEKKSISLLRIRILTGRTHQIRVHMGSIGHPIIGDTVYGDPELNSYIQRAFHQQRQFLHALKLKIPAAKLDIFAPLQADLAALLKSLEPFRCQTSSTTSTPNDTWLAGLPDLNLTQQSTVM